MSIHLIGYETSASEAALTAITPIPDPTLRISGNDFYVPVGITQVCCAAALINSAAATLRAEIQSPSLRATLNIDLSPINNGLVFGSLPRMLRPWQSPFQLAANEPLDIYVQNGGAVMNRGFIWLCDGAPKPVNGKIFTVRATASATLATATWVNSALTFQQTLPAGHYQLVGMRAWSANGVAARIFFVGGTWRPGVAMGNTENDNEWPDFRFGNTGVWGEFDNTTPPTVDFMGVTDSAQVVFFDLIKTQ
jgi:hypothetical protein